ncbi:MAG: hypothetical protein HYY26_05405, partial [Acidobacteria bacterium]|nr:hypothetical protein [Acidobacteriota bacterium]
MDAALQQSSPAQPALPAPSVSFEGLSNQDNFNAFGFRVLPPDTVGDVGPNHYVQMVNLLFRVFDKAGNPLTAPRKISSLFATLGAPCGTSDDGDPIVLYDPLADRWLLTQFALVNVATGDLHQCIALSQTADPTGAYFLYDFLMPNPKVNDYPKFGVWPDAYYMTDNQFDQINFFRGVGAFAFDRAKMLAGDPSASYIYFDLETFDPFIFGMLPADLDGSTPPPAGTSNYFSYFTAGEFGDPQGDSLRVFEFHADFAQPANSTFTERPESPLVVAAFNPLSPSGLDDIEQPPPASTATESLDAISDRLMHRLAYRNFSTYESLVTNHTVNVGTGNTLATHQAGVRYYELRRTLPGGTFVIHEQATFAPDEDNRWMGSAALDGQGNLAVCYSVSSLNVFPSIRCAGRLASDPPGGLFQGETTAQAGAFVQRSSTSRWGDYSALSVDPADDCTFSYTNEYYAADNPNTSAEWQTRIVTFSFPDCTTPANRPPVANAGPDQVVEATSPDPMPVTLDGSASSDLDGDPLSFEWRDATNTIVGTTAVVNLTLPLGVHTFTLTVDDGRGGTDSDAVAVTIEDTTPPAVSVTRPNGGEKLFTGTSYLIEWTASEAVGLSFFDVFFSTNGGASFNPVPGCTGLGGGARSCTWAAPGPTTTQGRIRVTAQDSSGNTASDSSNANFSIVSGAATITVTSPNTAVNWGVGSTQQIKWSHNLGLNAYVNIELSRDGGLTWELLAAGFKNTGGTASTFNWLVTGPNTTMARVRVTWTQAPTSDTSNVNFTLADPFIRVTTPSSSSTNWGYDTLRKQTWSTNLGPGDRVRLVLSTDGGGTFPIELVPLALASAKSAQFNTPTLGAPTSQARIRAEWTANPSLQGTNPVNFKIEPAFVRVTKPNLSTHVWTIGTTQTVTWANNLGSLERVKIELSTDGGSTFPIVLFNSTPSDGKQSL